MKAIKMDRYRGKPVTFYSEGKRIRADLHLPHPQARCILMSHGLESSKDGNKWRAFAPRFCDEGFASLRFSYRGCGEGRGKSEGEFEDTTITGRVRDFQAAIEFLLSMEVDSNRLGVIGSSFGGMVALAARCEIAKAMVLLATPAHFPALAEESKGVYLELPSGRRLRKKFQEELEKYDICREIKRIRCPILIIHGSEDEVVPVNNAYELYASAPEPKRLEIIAGANHALSAPEHLEKALDLSLEWFKRHLA